jgi:hypothetical protein
MAHTVDDLMIGGRVVINESMAAGNRSYQRWKVFALDKRTAMIVKPEPHGRH